MHLLLLLVVLLNSLLVFGQRNYDVQHYRFSIELSDHADVIVGKASVELEFLQPSSVLVMDLVNRKEEKGMQVFQVKENGRPVSFIHKQNLLEIRLARQVGAGEKISVEIEYMGQPEDGLIISTNKYRERTFFADNWPNRASHWLPCNDHPNDKASVEFIVKAPAHYKIISNGLLQEDKLEGNSRISHWKETLPLPTKVMVIGVARFAIGRLGDKNNIPVSAWVYPADSLKGVRDYQLAFEVLDYFEKLLGPYPYRKLANVQSTTIFGGMENASAIFYSENSIAGTGSSEALIAHEIAHQWFGNTVTEKSFAHLWLSEGFATYLTHMYIEQKYGRDSFYKRLAADRDQVVRFLQRNPKPVVDSVSDHMSLLNANSYQKGGWVLHMLRKELGDSVFLEVLRSFYREFQHRNADTRDFQQLVERISGRDLGWFFEQWLHRPGLPEVKISRKEDDRKITIGFSQGKDAYNLLFHIQSFREGREPELVPVRVNGNYNYEIPKQPGLRIEIVPVDVLFISK